jgi:hypothetical protein
MAKRLFHLRQRVVHAPMQRAQMLAVAFEPQWAMLDPLNRLDGVDHIQNAQFARRGGQRHPAPHAALRMHQPAAD